MIKKCDKKITNFFNIGLFKTDNRCYNIMDFEYNPLFTIYKTQ